MGILNKTEIIEALTLEIGENIYIDIAKWHLYLSDAKLDKVLAEKLLPLLRSSSIRSVQINEILQEIKVKVGGGKKELPLSDLIPDPMQSKLVKILEDIYGKCFKSGNSFQ